MGISRGLMEQGFLPERFLMVSNRLPYKLEVIDGKTTMKRNAGGLVAALDPVLRKCGGIWVGWSGSYDNPPPAGLIDMPGSERPYKLKPLALGRQETNRYYLGYSNRCLWPLFHYFQEYCEFNNSHWKEYSSVNARFADAVIEEYQKGDFIWVQDYHLTLVPAMIRKKIPDARIGYFLHIPFPSPEVFMVEPHAREILEGILGADLIGFHLDESSRNFKESVEISTSHRCTRSEIVKVSGRPVRVGSYPISIDFARISDTAGSSATEASVRELKSDRPDQVIAFGVDRLDYSKGIPQRLNAIQLMLEKYGDLRGRFTYIQVSSPSRTEIQTYDAMRQEIERLVGHINGRYGGRGCIPIDYRYDTMSSEELIAYYRAADVALVTPLRDGMNLVAKEFIASRVDNDGVLVLSRLAGAARELKDAVLVNPYDTEGMAESFYSAINMPHDEQERRMRNQRNIVNRNDIYWWLERFLRDAETR